jgi:hypothetical protein
MYVRIFDTTDLQLQRTILADSGRMDYTANGEDAVMTPGTERFTTGMSPLQAR